MRPMLRLVRIVSACVIAPLLMVMTASAASFNKTVSAGDFFSTRINADATVSSWGENTSGELGDGTSLTRSVPVLVRGLSNVTHISSGKNHTLALTADGSVFAWGGNGKGQLGLGTNVRASVRASRVTGVPPARFVSAFGDSSVMLGMDGSVWLWGAVLSANAPRKTASIVAANESAVAVGLGGTTGAIVLADGSVKLWALSDGLLPKAQFVNGSNAAPLKAMARLAGAGSSVFAVASDGKCWEMAVGLAREVVVAGGKLCADVAATVAQIAWVTTTGDIYLTGDNSTGQFGNGSQSSASSSSPAQRVAAFSEVAVGPFHTVAKATTGVIWAWGYNAFGELGGGARQYVAEPLQSIGLNGFARVSAGRKHSIGMSAGGAVSGWGNNEFAQTGVPSASDVVRAPSPVGNSFAAVDVSAAQSHSAALGIDGAVYTWGDGSSGQIGDGSGGAGARAEQPVRVAGLPSAKAIATGIASTYAISASGELYGWGRNTSGNLATGDASSASLLPVKALSLPGSRRYASIAAGRAHAAAIADDGSLWLWGDNAFKQLARTDLATTATPIAGPFAATSRPKTLAVATAYNSTLALQEDGTVWIWGETVLDGDRVATPTMLSTLPKIAAVATSGYTYAALGADGSLWTWGRNTSLAPAPFLSHVKFASLGGGAFADSLFARDVDGRWWVLGYNAYGQLGFGGETKVQELLPLATYNPSLGTQNSTDVTEFLTDRVGPAGERYFLSAEVAQSAFLDTLGNADGTYFWGRTGRGFRGWTTRATAPTTATEVYRFYCIFPDGKPNTHFYTANAADKTALASTNPTNETGKGCRYEGVAFYSVAPNYSAYTSASTASLVSESCPTGYQPVYRAFNNRVALNDGNHRMSTSWIDHVRSTRYLGFVDEGVVLCSPVSTAPGGDLHAFHAYPGPEVKSGQQIKAEFIFANNGPGHGNDARLVAEIPAAVTDWSVTCTARLGAMCPATYTAQALRSGISVYALPAGGALTFTLTGTAPLIASESTNTIELRFGNSIEPSQIAPDPFSQNNTTQISSTQVKALNVCTYGITVDQISMAAAGGTGTTTVVSNAGCALSADVIAANQGGNTISTDWVSVSFPNGRSANATSSINVVKLDLKANPGPLSRTATISINGRTLTVFQDAPQVVPPSVTVACVTQLTPQTEHAAATGYTRRSVAVSTSASTCKWTAKSDVDWLNIVATASGSGAGALTYSVQANPGIVARSGKIKLGNTEFNVYQEGGTTSEAAGGGSGDGGGDGGAGASGGGGEGPGGE